MAHTLTFALIFLLLLPFTLILADTPPNDIDTAIITGMQYVDRMYYEINSTHAVCLDCAETSFRLRRNDGKWVIIGKETGSNYPDNPGGDQIAGGGLTEIIQTIGVIGGAKEITDWKFDVNGDKSYGDVILRTEYWSVNDTWMKCTGTITYCDLKGYTASLWLDEDKVIDSVAKDATFTRQQEYGWSLHRYVARHVTKQLAGLYNYIGVWNGVNYTARAEKLLRSWYDFGYKYDINDAIYFASNDGRPDYHVCNWVGINYNYGWIVSNDTYPDPEMWTNLPIICNDNNFVYPYKSRLGYGFARDVWLYGTFVWTACPLIPSAGGPYPLIDAGGYTIFGIGCQAQLNWALHLMNKYGNAHPYIDQAKAYILEAPWNGLGIVAEVEGGVTLWTNPAYGLHVVTTYAVAVIRYYQLTGDEWYAERADDVIGVLLKLQQRVGHNQLVGEYKAEVYRADCVGGFMPGYRWGGGWEYWDCLCHCEFYGQIYWGLARLADLGDIFGLKVGYREDPCAFPGVSVCNTEGSIPAVMSLFLYKQLGRTPSSSGAQFALPFFDISSVNYTESTYGTKKIDLSSARYGNIRVGVIGSIVYGVTWYVVTYTWSGIKISTALSNFRTKLSFYYPYCQAADGNSLEIYVEVYNSSNTLVVSDYRKPKELDGLSGTGEYYLSVNNLALKGTLPADTYTIKLRFRFSCGGSGGISIGLIRLNSIWYNWGEPMYLDVFGYDGDKVVTTVPTYNLNIQSSGPGTVSPAGLVTYNEGQTTAITATPTGATNYEYTAGVDNAWTIYSSLWVAQTFTTTVESNVTSVKLMMFRYGNPGTLTVSIRATSGGHPTGSDLSNGTINANLFTTTPYGVWYEIPLTSYTLAASTKYAIVCRATSGSAFNAVYWSIDSSAPTYSGGCVESSTNSGTSWSSVSGSDMMFQVLTTTSNYFWFWIIKNTRLDLWYSSPLYTLSLALSGTYAHDWNVTAYFGATNFAIKGTYPLTIKGDINLDRVVSIKDLTLVINKVGKYSGQEDWETSYAKMFDLLLVPDNVIDIKDYVTVINNYGKVAP